MTAPRTVTVPTLDHGPVVMTEPAWCAGHADEPTELRCDTGHTGTPHPLMYEGLELAYSVPVQDPFAPSGRRSVGVLVELGPLANRLTPAELDVLAGLLVDYAGTLRRLARQLSALHAGEAR
ncbi:hypothetical protein FKN01_00040 [Streptomyces sp. 130]|uniref:DUF6907 domain-containing protein n=1 Tax=Streptomyces sp. 130 TaxID=2591006 RepID=UPI00117FD3C2|nr:hypothetical protein [Streptomyces sp. 130]TRV81746.1 hypothetical protein FKN01_00040 [Streptomyces sp. 130]